VRDALKRLVAEHALTMLPNRTLCVPRMTRPRFQELLQVRLSLETMLTRRAAEFIGVEEIQALERINAEMQTRWAPTTSSATSAPTSPSTSRSLRRRQQRGDLPHRGIPVDAGGPVSERRLHNTGTRNARDDHTKILKALRRRDAVAAAEAVAAISRCRRRHPGAEEFVLDAGSYGSREIASRRKDVRPDQPAEP